MKKIQTIGDGQEEKIKVTRLTRATGALGTIQSLNSGMSRPTREYEQKGLIETWWCLNREYILKEVKIQPAHQSDGPIFRMCVDK